MSWIQRFLQKHFPGSAAAMEAESRQWMLQCTSCGHEQSYWEIGGVRWGASSKGKRVWKRCRNCHKFVGHRVYRKRVPESGATGSGATTENPPTGC
jgi:hypothetical protein